jgi:hypothetical protein
MAVVTTAACCCCTAAAAAAADEDDDDTATMVALPTARRHQRTRGLLLATLVLYCVYTIRSRRYPGAATTNRPPTDRRTNRRSARKASLYGRATTRPVRVIYRVDVRATDCNDGVA